MRILILVALAVLLVSGTSRAADEAVSKPPADQAAAAGQAVDQAEPVGTPMQTSGKVISLKSCKLVGVADPHVLVKIQTEQGETDIVDLGTAVDLKSNGIEAREGQQLWVSGRVGRINDKELLVAESFSESKLVTIVRSSPLREETEKHANARGEGKDSASVKSTKDAKSVTLDAGMQVRTIDGTVMNSRKLKIEGEAEEHVICKLQTEDGIVVVDLGSSSTLPKVDLSEGQAVAVTGYVGHLNSKPIIVADSVGNLSSIQSEVAPAKTQVLENKNPQAGAIRILSRIAPVLSHPPSPSGISPVDYWHC